MGLLTGVFSLIGIKDGEDAVYKRIDCNLSAISMDSNNVQKEAAVFTLVDTVGIYNKPFLAYLRLLIMAKGVVLTTVESNVLRSELSYRLPVDNYGVATTVTVEAYEDASYSKKLCSLSVNIVRESPIPFPRSEAWTIDLKFQNGEYIMVDNVIYMWKNPVMGNSLVSPETDVLNNPETTSWIAYQNWPLLSTQILMANFAKLASAVFYGDYMFSQQGIDKRGIATTAYDDFGKETFTPNFQVNFKTGEINALKGTFRANVLPTPEVYVLRKADIFGDIDISTSINSTLIFFSSNYDVNGNVAVIPSNSIVKLNLDSISQYAESDPHGTLYGKIKIINQSTLTLHIYSSYTASVSQPFFIFPSKAILAYPGFGTANLNSGVKNELYLTPGAVLDAYIMRTTQENAVMKVAVHILNPGDFEYKKDPKGLEYILISKGLKIE